MALHNGNICVVQHIVLSNAYTNSMCCYTPVYSIKHHVEQLVSVEQRIYWCESTLLKLPDASSKVLSSYFIKYIKSGHFPCFFLPVLSVLATLCRSAL